MGDIKLKPSEKVVLECLAEKPSDFGYCDFATIAGDTGLDRHAVRLACRSLKRKGLVAFASGLTNEDGEFRGSGYGCSSEGRLFLDSLIAHSAGTDMSEMIKQAVPLTAIVWRDYYEPSAIEAMTKLGTLPRYETPIDTRLECGSGVARLIAEKCFDEDAERFREGGWIVILEPEEFAGRYKIAVEYEPVFYAYSSA